MEGTIELNTIHDNHEHASVSLKIILLVFAVVLIGALAFLIYKQNTQPDTTDYSAQSVKSQGTKTSTEGTTSEDETKDWQTYTDAISGFTFRYPPTTTINSNDNKSITSDTQIAINTYNLKTMADEPLGYDKATLIALRDDLIAGKVKTYLPNLYAKNTLVLSQLEVCDVQFTQVLQVFDGGDLMVDLNYSIPSSKEDTVIKNNPAYFSKDTTNCGNQDIWKGSNAEAFRTDLEAGKTDTVSQGWRNSFSKIAQSFKFTK